MVNRSVLAGVQVWRVSMGTKGHSRRPSGLDLAEECEILLSDVGPKKLMNEMA